MEGQTVSSILARHGMVETPTGEGVTEGKLLDAMAHKGIVHVDSHAIFYPDKPEESGIQLSGNVMVSARTLATAVRTTSLDLVFLAACESGLACTARSPERFSGPPPAILSAGARNVVATLWPVPDVSATFFSTYFYEQNADGRVPAPAAVHATQLWLKNATTGELNSYLAKISGDGDIPLNQLGPILQYLSRFNAQDRPFSRPYYWAGYVVFGG